MVTLEQIKLLESKITRAVNFVIQVTEENGRLKKRNAELEGAIEKLREEKTKMEEGIASALGKLNQFEDAIERSLSSAKPGPKPVEQASAPQESVQQAAVQQKTVPAEPLPQKPAQAKPAVPSAYTVDEKSEEEAELADEIEDSDETELDLF